MSYNFAFLVFLDLTLKECQKLQKTSILVVFRIFWLFLNNKSKNVEKAKL